jgi:hypothetical protein
MKHSFGRYEFAVREAARAASLPIEELFSAISRDLDTALELFPATKALALVEMMILQRGLKSLHVFIESAELSEMLPRFIRKPERVFFDRACELGSGQALFLHRPTRQGLLMHYSETVLLISRKGRVWFGPWHLFENVQDEEVMFCFSLAAYMTKYPDLIVPGFPESLKHPNEYKRSANVSVKTHSRLLGRAPLGGPVMAYWKTYRSDRYINMQGQVELILPYVRGKCRIVTVKEAA